MKKIALIILAFSKISIAQNLKEYYQLENKAELAIVDSNYVLAAKYYKEAFSFNTKPITRDIYNYGLINFLMGKKNEGLAQFQKLINLNYNIENLNKIEKTPEGKTIFNNYLKFLKKIKPSLKKHVNQTLKKQLLSLYENDQFFRTKEGSYEIYGDTIRKIDIENDKKLRKIIQKFGYPDDYLIGINNDLDLDHPFDIVIWHQTTMNRIGFWEDDLKKAVYQGKLEPHRAAALIENHNGMDTYLIKPISQFNCNSCSESVKNEIEGKYYYYLPKSINAKNKARGEIYLESIEDYMKKLSFSMNKATPFNFNYKEMGYGSIYSMADENSLKQLLKGLLILK